MTKGNRSRAKKRLPRIMRLLKRIRPASVPVTFRNNRVVLLPDGPAYFRSLHAAIRSAQRYILLEYYMIRADRTGYALAGELAVAVERGIRVFLIYDYIGCVDTPPVFFKYLAQRGVELLPFNRPSFRRGLGWFDKRDHRKMAVIDGTLAFMGGFNIGNEYAGVVAMVDCFRDLGFSISGTAVQQLVNIFCETWQMERGDLPELPTRVVAPRDKAGTSRRHGQANVIIVSGGPHHRSSYIRSAFLLSIASASEEILIATPYFVPGPLIIRGLLRARRRGVRVCLLLPSRCDVPIVSQLGRSYYGILLKQGIEIYEMTGKILHAKVMLIDGERTVLGSANLDQRSFHRNFELNAIIDSSAYGGQIRRLLQEDFSHSKQVVLQHHEDRGVFVRMLERVVDPFSWFL